ncbi:transporter, dicarboxylate/amino acid:cation Na+/H+ symporter family protein [Oesophagostomum dentatum]|uniref:Amino acid transporter n=1 Tax=Oesophagostomum dentatum TaxID=61180 RepID=A0A0B1SZ52_OESDE|nr:transporter, dicarboxylate/amino acid:cation Na+/H+ symporter family protein [Oesophagostomum dentatum]
MHQSKSWLQKNLLLILTISGVFVGAIGGGLLRLANPGPEVAKYIGFPGELFLNMLKAIILPLIVASLISGLSQLDSRTSGNLGRRALLYYALTTTHAVILGIIIVMIIHPGDPRIKGLSNTQAETVTTKITAADKFLDLLRNMLPDNIVRSTFQQRQTTYTSIQLPDGREIEKTRLVYSDGMNVLGLIIFCIVMGVIISRLGKRAKPLADFFITLDLVITKMVFVIMWFGPIGIPSLIAQKMLEVEDLIATARTLGMFILTVIIGLLVQCFGTLPLIYFIGTRQNPYPFLRGLGQAIVTALGTSSSAASLPATFRCLDELGVDSRVSKFVLPIGAMVNMSILSCSCESYLVMNTKESGCRWYSLYEATASIFIAQINGMSLSAGQVLTVSVTATLAAIGAASIPGAGLVTMMIVLTAIGLPVNDISLIISIDWFLDRLRTSVNIIGDAYGCGFVYQRSKHELEELCKNGDACKEVGEKVDNIVHLASKTDLLTIFSRN